MNSPISLQTEELIKYLGNFNKLDNVKISPEQTARLEWFIKDVAVHAVNPENKPEFTNILQENNVFKLADFIIKYVPDFKQKFAIFMDSF